MKNQKAGGGKQKATESATCSLPSAYCVLLSVLTSSLIPALRRFRERSYELEHLDKGDYTPEEYAGCQAELRRINRFLGDASALRRSLFPDIERAGLKRLALLDVGAGSGELLRAIAPWARQTGRDAQLVGLEFDAHAARSIREESRRFPNIISVRGNALHLPFADDSFDYAICSLFTHHFTDEQAVVVLRELSRVARRRIFVVDLHRHPLAYFLYTTIGRLFLHNRLIREDGALSILRSFRPEELYELALHAGLTRLSVRRRFPFRLVLSGRKSEAARGQKPQEHSPVQLQADHEPGPQVIA